jgi:sugar phosphate isomerase/epimerase
VSERSVRELLKYIVDSGVSGIELMGPAAEIYAGSPAAAGRWRGSGAPGRGQGGGRRELTPEEQQVAQERATKLKKWRFSVSMDKYTELRKMYNDAGVRIGDFAAKKHMLVACHAHTQATMTAWDAVLDQSKGNAIHLDCGGSDGGDNLAWGHGEAPIREILQLIRKEKYSIPASIELEYQIPEGSDAVAEVAKCVQFCKAALT